jgi:hypothetical protein
MGPTPSRRFRSAAGAHRNGRLSSHEEDPCDRPARWRSRHARSRVSATARADTEHAPRPALHGAAPILAFAIEASRRMIVVDTGEVRPNLGPGPRPKLALLPLAPSAAPPGREIGQQLARPGTGRAAGSCSLTCTPTTSAACTALAHGEISLSARSSRLQPIGAVSVRGYLSNRVPRRSIRPWSIFSASIRSVPPKSLTLSNCGGVAIVPVHGHTPVQPASASRMATSLSSQRRQLVHRPRHRRIRALAKRNARPRTPRTRPRHCGWPRRSAKSSSACRSTR